jgi:hypothetical protein
VKVVEGQVKMKVWRPDGPAYEVWTATSPEEVAGSLVFDGMPKEEYWPQVAAGYRANCRRYYDLAVERVKQEYAADWVSRWIHDTNEIMGLDTPDEICTATRQITNGDR